jgi:hypothetical protein
MAYDGTNVVLFGGNDGSNQGDTWVWNGTVWSDVTSATSPTARQYHAMASDGTSAVLFGGNDGSRQDDIWVWNGTIWSDVTPATSGPTARQSHAMAYDGTNFVVFGGNDGSYQDDTWAWNGTIWSDVTPATSPTARMYHAVAFDSTNGVAVLLGGYDGSNYLDDTWEWDGSAWSLITPSGDKPGERRRHAMAFDSANGVVVMFGGEREGTSWSFWGDTWTYNAATNTWAKPIGNWPEPRRHHTMAYDSARGVTVLFGGAQGGNDGIEHYFEDTWEYDGTAWTDVSPATGTAGIDWPEARRQHAMVYDSANGVMVLFGGGSDNGSNMYNDVWEWNGTAWTEITPSGSSPVARRGHQMAYDSSRGVVVLFGGQDSDSDTIYNDTWEWDGSTWVQFTSSPPSKRHAHAMAYDSARGVVVMFGGYDRNNDLGDTWERNGTTWTDVTTVGGTPGTDFPSLRRWHKMAYDSARGVIVLFAGDEGQGTPLNDTWELDGHTWREVQFSGAEGYAFPTERRAHSMAYDSARGVVVLFGGNPDSDDHWMWSDTWEY